MYKGGLFQKFPIEYVTIFSNNLVVVAGKYVNKQARVPGKPISANRGLNRFNTRRKFTLRLVSVSESTISTIQEINTPSGVDQTKFVKTNKMAD